MTALTIKQRAKINAALCIIHDSGLDANAVNNTARTIIGTGHNPTTAYERALNQFADSNPQLLPTMSKVIGLIEASSPRTVAQYDQALSAYIETGDDSALMALAPMIAEDSIALALNSGEITPEEAAAGDLSKALGFEASPEFQQAATPTGTPSPAPAASTSPQVSQAGDGPGMMAPKAQRKWSDTPYTGSLSVGQGAAPGTSFAGAKETARGAANRGSVVTIDEPS